ncbi:hypothetical protein M433DRAFT_536313 [Acidomyces richmondensis BFW]|nr:MAG: hypothetical protein FE78DRAFT_539429 [Acidomyces sp. 'richmondensis']KYG49865.1 hypothetical protein M433DRAFT_536313 [Acidomyces richmondensis BFW]
MYHRDTQVSVEFTDYFKGPRNIYSHSKWPIFMRLHGSVVPKMIVPITFLAAWATAVTTISKLVHNISISTVLLTMTGFVVALALSFRSSTAYERYMEGRKYWQQLQLAIRNMSRTIWIHVQERHAESADLDLLGKLAALQLLNAFAVSLKHRLRFEPSTEYPDLQPLISNIYTFAGQADQTALREPECSKWKLAGQALGFSFAESDPRKLIKGSKENLGNTPNEILTYIAAYVDNVFSNKTLTVGPLQNQLVLQITVLADVLTGVERVVNTPLPIAYSISISQITWMYVLALPFQLAATLGWIAIPGTVIAGYIILGIATIGRELENPFGEDVNDLPLDAYCHEIANDIDALTSRPAPLNNNEWMRDGGSMVLWPLSNLDYKVWERRSTEEIRAALRTKAQSRDVALQRMDTFYDGGERGQAL